MPQPTHQIEYLFDVLDQGEHRPAGSRATSASADFLVAHGRARFIESETTEAEAIKEEAVAVTVRAQP